MQTTLIVIHVIISVILIVSVLMQQGRQQGLSGAIAGGAETFFGKNKGRTLDAIFKKVTAIVAVLFVVSSVVLAAYSINKNNADAKALEAEVQQQIETQTENAAEAETENADANADAADDANADAAAAN